MTAVENALRGSGAETGSIGGAARRTAVTGMVLWGLLHLVGGAVMMIASFGNGPDAVGTYATGLPAVELTATAASAATGLVGFHGFNIAAAGMAVTWLAWRRRTGPATEWRTPLVIAGIADIGLVVFLLIPGVMSAADGAPGIGLLLVALAGTAAARARS